jgi:hypothetical protein
MEEPPSKVRRVGHTDDDPVPPVDDPVPPVDDLLAEHTMTTDQRVNVYVRTIVCGTGLFFFDDTITALARRFKCGVSAAHDGQMTTWLPRHHVPILIAGTESHKNVVITCRSGDCYDMSHALRVPPLPAGVVLVCNCTVNTDGTFIILVYDGENLPLETGEPGTTAPGNMAPTSIERYQRLRAFFPRIFNNQDTSMFMIQWVGYYEHACKFMSGEIPVPHEISGLLSTTEDALTPSRPVRVKIPNLVIKRFQDPA